MKLRGGYMVEKSGLNFQIVGGNMVEISEKSPLDVYVLNTKVNKSSTFSTQTHNYCPATFTCRVYNFFEVLSQKTGFYPQLTATITTAMTNLYIKNQRIVGL